MRRLIFITLSLLVIMHVAYAKSIVSEEKPFVTFEKLYAPESVKQGQLYQLSADISVQKNVWEDTTVFLHITNPADNKILINNNFHPAKPSVQWTPQEIIKLGPVNGYIPVDFPAGTYNIQMGIYYGKTSPEGEVFVRLPYTNNEIKDFVVGKIKVEEAKPETEKKKEDLIISNFEAAADLVNWQTRDSSIERDTESAAEGKYCMKIRYLKNRGCCPSAVMESFFDHCDPKFSDWSGYDQLQFQVYSLKQKDGHTYLGYPVTLQIKDKSGNRYQLALPVQDRDKPMSVALSAAGKFVDTSKIGNLSFFVGSTPPDRDIIVYLDDVKLVASWVAKPKGAFVKFEGLKISKDKVKPGDELEITPSFSITQKFIEDYTLYIHLYRALDNAGWINADSQPLPPTTEWEINKVITQGPFRIYIPTNAPVGKYNIEMGLFLEKYIPSGAQYIQYHRTKDGVYQVAQPSYSQDSFKQPYMNYEAYGDWVVGSFEVTPP